MTRRSRRSTEAPPAPQSASPQDAPQPVARRQARAVAQTLSRLAIRPPHRILDLCCGLGRQAESLARSGYRIVGVDIRHDPRIRAAWQDAARRQPRLRFVSGDVRRLPLQGPFAAGLLLYNSLALFHRNDHAIQLLRDLRRVIAPHGVLLINNLCRDIWREIAAGRYADGLSDDGLWQMTWLAGRNIFTLRYGDQVRPDRPRPRRCETLYRAWSLDELDLLCRLGGWTLDPACRNRPLLLARPSEPVQDLPPS